MATISDVSRIAGVSKATVSRVINGTGPVKQSTRELVEAVMKELKYKPSSVAQALATKSGNSVGLVLSDFTGSYFGILLKQASDSSEKMGKQLLIADGHNIAERELAAVHSLVEKRCDVIVLYSRMLSTDQIIALNRSIDIPLINLGRQLPEEAGYSIAFDQQHAIALAVEHLIAQGHQKLLYLGPEATTPTSISRKEGFFQTTSKYPQLDGKVHHEPCAFGFVEGYESTKRLIERGFCCTAIVAGADDIAIGCIKAMNEKGIAVPETVSVIGIDNDPCSPFITPSLTTVDNPIQTMMARAMEVAQSLVAGHPAPTAEMIKGELIIRDSTKTLS
ncbi:LacI family DNA-binding transcriptional regulator [Vibrio nereis]|uniref:LacI family transcriptional regulator n=1 Tax=Vibrio nereis TaxID=693 RepID=A0A0M0HKG4_VIBNE|nr:LacI family DNA-binding transcriptional regulator [Vibrio nereis]KOO02263.1 LacI family transcriptional regulator [Vibrio nereis]